MENGAIALPDAGTENDSSGNIAAFSDHLLTTLPLVANVPSESLYARAGYWLSKRRDGRSTNWMIARWESGTVIYRSCRTQVLEEARAALDRFVEQAPATRAPVLNRKPEMVYFIQASTGQIKIGTAHNVSARLSQLRTMSPVALDLLATCEGGQPIEFSLHQRFAAHRLHGEWFSPHPDILAEIERLSTPGKPGHG